jgi:large subunit ribosomal protein L9
MRLLLRSDVDGLGKKGDLVEVADGYGRNYLLPKGFALPASAGIQAQADAMSRARSIRDTRDRSSAEEVATALVGKPVTIAHRAGEAGRLYGSVTAADIVEAVQAQTHIELDRRKLNLEEPIRSLGTHTVMAKLHADVEFPITVEVVPEG